MQKTSEFDKKYQGRNPYNIPVAILVETMTPKRHFEVNRPLIILQLIQVEFHLQVVTKSVRYVSNHGLYTEINKFGMIKKA